MKAIILAAGRGSRMHEGTKNNPKCMMKVCGKTLLNRCIENIERAGFEKNDIAIVTGYKSDVIRSAIKGVTFFHNEEWERTNMVYSLTQAHSWLSKEDCCVFYSDIIFSPTSVKHTIKKDGDIVIPYYTEYLDLWKKRFDNPLEDLETFQVDSNGTLKDIGSKPTSYDQIGGQYMGIVKFTPNGWNLFMQSLKNTTKSLEKVDMTSMLNATLRSGIEIQCVRCSDLWLECDNLNDVKVYEREYQFELNK